MDTLPPKHDKETKGSYYFRLHNQHKYSFDAIALEFDTQPINVYWTYQKFKKRRQGFIEKQDLDIPFPTILNPEKPLHIESNSAIVCCDWHIPGHNKLMLERLCAIADKESIQDLFVIGDIYDFPSLSRFTHNQKEVTANEVIRIGGKVMKPVFNRFKRVILSPGNHDEHFSRALDDTFDFELLINASMGKDWPNCEIVISNLDYVFLNDNWIIGHPSNYSGQGAKTPSDYADLYQRNVITGHNHIVGLAQSKSGNYIGIDTGAMLTQEAIFYSKRRMNKYTRWQNGFTVIKNGFAKLYTECFTDWKAEGID